MLREIIEWLERNETLDRVAAPIDKVARPVLTQQPVSKTLSGAWLGHRLHPMLTDMVIGTWSSASLLDTVGGEEAQKASRQLVGIGIVSAVPTVVSGVHDWLDYGTKVRRSGLVHAIANQIGLALQVASWRARRRGEHARGAWLSAAGITATGVGGYLGAHLSYVLGAGVERTAFEDGPTEWTPAVPLSDLAERQGRAVEVGGVQVLLVRDGDGALALADTCNHAGCSLAGGDIADGAVTCPCHGSRFRLHDGKTLAGPAADRQPTYATRVRDGMVEVRAV